MAERERNFDRCPDERTMLLQELDWYRGGILWKVEGLTDEQAGRRLVPSDSNISGLVKHLALVEESWFSVEFEGLPPSAWWAEVDFETDPNWEFRTGAEDGIESCVARYRQAIDASRAVVAHHELGDLATGPSRRREFNLRWTLQHLISETAQHLGHIDILRELTDGVTGD